MLGVATGREHHIVACGLGVSMGTVIANFTQLAGMFSREAAGSERMTGLAPGDEALLGRALAALEDAESAAEQSAQHAEPDVLLAPNDQAAALLQTYMAERALEAGQVHEAHAGTLEARFDNRDIGWLRAAIPFIKEKLGIAKRAPRPEFSDQVVTLPNQATIAVLGDWGTGLYGARPCAATIADEGGYDALLHLGDVYYSGSSSEIRRNFLDIWATMRAGSPNAVNRACNSNHEMYSGGGPLFELTLPEFGQASTAFVLASDYFVIVGIDTAYDDHDLDDDQMRWLNRVVGRLDGRQLVLLSHHQPFSLLGAQGPKLTRRLAALLEGRRVFAWYWGHEHLLALYEPHAKWGLRGRCVGHGGFPYFRKDFGAAPVLPLKDRQIFRVLPGVGDVPGARVLDGPNDYLGDRAHKYGPNGFMRLRLDGPVLHEEVVTPAGELLWQGDLT